MHKNQQKKNQSKEDLLMSNISLEETILLAGGFSLNVVAETYAEEKLKC
jgi:preprotein translocase subunit YajC